jgi:NAD(P)-dependent dehydrogenase (short-subunit alcohol dehydrogenase family)
MGGGVLEGQVAVVTGAARRIGRRIARRLAEEGAAVVVNYARSKADAETLVEEIIATGRRALAWQADVTRSELVGEMFAAVEADFGRVDILVNNAGIFSPVNWEKLSEAQWDTMMDTNLKAQFFCAQAAAPLMKRQGRGRIINISSIGGLLPWPKYTHYCVSKAGVIMLTRCLARALAPEITVNSVAPGAIQFPGELPDEDYIRRTPLGRAGTAEDIADAVLFLARADHITGQVIVIDGGRSLG